MGRFRTSIVLLGAAAFIASFIFGVLVSVTVDIIGLSFSPVQTGLAAGTASLVLVSGAHVAFYGIPPWRSESTTLDVDTMGSRHPRWE